MKRAFTLIEMLVAIGILVLLTGLLVSGSAALVQRSEIRETETAITILDDALREWERRAERRLVRRPGGELDPQTPFIFVITEVLRTARRTDAVRDLLARIDPSRLYTYSAGEIPPWIRVYAEEQALPLFIGEMTVLDAWGTPIYATHPGELSSSGVRDEDGTERTLNERYYGSCIHRRTCFVSAGPDGLFGLDTEFPGMAPPTREAAKEEARSDNVYSYLPAFP